MFYYFDISLARGLVRTSGNI